MDVGLDDILALAGNPHIALGINLIPEMHRQGAIALRDGAEIKGLSGVDEFQRVTDGFRYASGMYPGNSAPIIAIPYIDPDGDIPFLVLGTDPHKVWQLFNIGLRLGFDDMPLLTLPFRRLLDVQRVKMEGELSIVLDPEHLAYNLPQPAEGARMPFYIGHGE